MRGVSLAARLREVAGDVPQKVIAQRSGIGSDQVSKIFSGETKDPRWSTMIALLRDGLSVNLDDFATEGETPETPLTPYDTRPEYRAHIANLEAISESDRAMILLLVEKYAAAVGNPFPQPKPRKTVTTPSRPTEPSDSKQPTDKPTRPIGMR